MPIKNIVISILTLCATTVYAVPLKITYGGRLVDSDGNPLTGSQNVTVQFFNNTTCAGGVTKSFTVTPTLPEGGTFNEALTFTDAEMVSVFDTGASSVNVTSTLGTNACQEFTSSPYAFNVRGLSIDSSGNVGIKTIPTAALDVLGDVDVSGTVFVGYTAITGPTVSTSTAGGTVATTASCTGGLKAIGGGCNASSARMHLADSRPANAAFTCAGENTTAALRSLTSYVICAQVK